MGKQNSFLNEIDLSIYSPSFVEKIIKSRMIAVNCDSKEDYFKHLDSRKEEVECFKKALNNNYSIFFRSPLVFSFIEQQLLPALAASKATNHSREIRIWSAACAAGHEAYSLAILCHEYLQNYNQDIRFRIFASDVSEKEIRAALKAVYYENAVENVSLKRFKTYFEKKGSNFLLQNNIKSYVDFSVFDLLNTTNDCPPSSIFGNFDIVICANLLFYYTPETQKFILNKLSKSVADNGFLIVGETEKEIVDESYGYLKYSFLPVFKKIV